MHTTTWIDRLGLDTLARSAGLAGALFLGCTVLVLLLEMRGGAKAARLKSKSFINDVIYSAFYRGGFYAVFVWAIVVNALGDHLGFLQLNLLRDLPLVVSLPVYWIVGDFIAYWVHRAQHRAPFLWAFHSVHHAERQLSTLSQSRRHPVEQVLNGLSLHLPLVFILGLPTRAWLPWYIIAQMLQSLQHAELDWRFGPLYRVVVSPTFHSIHHSTEARHFNENFALMFSMWDYLFGTASAGNQRPQAYGVEGLTMDESIPAQLLAPLRMLARKPARVVGVPTVGSVEPTGPENT